MKISGRTFVVSGGSSGLGRATVEALLAEGANVAVLDLRAPGDLENDNSRFLRTDVADLSQLEEAVNSVSAWAGESKRPLGGVINCAGVGIVDRFTDSNPGTWNKTLAVNLTGTYNLSRLVVSQMIKDVTPDDGDGERGVIIMVSSQIAYGGVAGQTAYAATKGAIRSMTLPLAREIGKYGIRVVDIAPGMVLSEMTAHTPKRQIESMLRETPFPRRFGHPHEFAETVKWILTCIFVNGESIRLTGGGRLPAKM